MSEIALRGADLHLHTVCSDGLYTPESLVEAALQKGFRAIALTDHDSIAGISAAQRAAQGRGIEIIAGVEFSAAKSNYDSLEIHIVGLFLDTENPELRQALARSRDSRKNRALRIIEKLNRMGLEIRPDDVFGQAPPESIGRLHIARALVRSGRIRTINAAFRRWLGPNGPAFVPRERPTVAETIALIHRAGGLAVLAHPGKTGGDEEIPSLAQAGLDAVEVYCPDHSPSQERRYLEIARQYGLLASGGSDCHGDSSGCIMLGRVRLEETDLEALRRKAGRY